MRWSRSTT